MKVLVLGHGVRSFLAVLRSLGRKGIDVHVAGCPVDDPARQSRYLRAVHDIPPYCPDARGWFKEVAALLAREDFDLVVPTNDSWILPLQRHRRELERFAHVYLLDDRVFHIVTSKTNTTALARSLGIPVPEERVVTDEESTPELERFITELGLPVVVKPETSYTIARLTRKRDVRVASTVERVRAALAECLRDGPGVLQRWVPGVGVGVEFLADRGNVLVAFQHRRLHEPPDGGGSLYRISEHVTPALGAAVERMLLALEYTGVGMAEFRVDPSSGRWTFLELNGRFWGSLSLAVASGADFPGYLFDFLVEGRRRFPRHYRAGIRSRDFVKDLKWSVRRRAFGDLGRLMLPGERLDALTFDDPLPAVAEVRNLVKEVTFRAYQRARRAVERTPLRVVARARARRILGTARRVLFVCKGNICRGPFAERYFAATTAGQSIAARSAGYYPVGGRPSPATACNAASGFGVDLSDHRSRVLSTADIEWADAIVVFDLQNERTVALAFPGSVRRLVRLALLIEFADEIPDPHTGELNRIEAAYQSVAKALRTASSARLRRKYENALPGSYSQD